MHTLDAIFRPRSVAVAGASRREGTLGWRVVDNLLRFGFTGPVYAVNPNADSVHSLKAFAAVDAIPDPVDLAVLVVPAAQVVPVAEACARKGVRGMVVISAGFRETGGEGIAREEALVAVARTAGIRIVGPNCMGAINTEAAFRLDASFGAALPVPGSVGFLTQSGALGETILHHLSALDLGLSQFVSIGNKSDLDIHEFLDFWADERGTEAVLLYLESFGDPAKFAAAAKRLSRRKPLVVVKAGRTREGARAAVSHTGSLAGVEYAQDALLEECGAIRVASVQELFDLAKALVHQPLPRGGRVGIVTNAGGPGILAADACAGLGLTLPRFSEATRVVLRANLLSTAAVENPVDVIASAGVSAYEAATRAVLADPEIDAVLAICVPPVTLDVSAVAQAVARIASGSDKTVLGCFMGVEEKSLSHLPGLRRLPSYPYPEQAAQVLFDMVRHTTYRARPEGTVPTLRVDAAEASRCVAALAADGATPPEFPQVAALLRAYGIVIAETRVCAGAERAAEAASELGFPVVVKLHAPGVTHKTDVGGVVTNVRSSMELDGACFRIQQGWERSGRSGAIPGLLVQRMVSGGVETIVGASSAVGVGRLVMFGLGGVFTEVIRDVAFRMHPLTDVEAAAMVRAIRGWPLLAGYRGAAPADVDALTDVLLRVSALLTDFPQISELDLNPLIVRPVGQGAVVADARLTLQ